MIKTKSDCPSCGLSFKWDAYKSFEFEFCVVKCPRCDTVVYSRRSKVEFSEIATLDIVYELMRDAFTCINIINKNWTALFNDLKHVAPMSKKLADSIVELAKTVNIKVETVDKLIGYPPVKKSVIKSARLEGFPAINYTYL